MPNIKINHTHLRTPFVFFAGVLIATTCFSGDKTTVLESPEDEVELEGDPLLTQQFIKEAEMEEEESRKRLISYAGEVPTVIAWCVTEDLQAKHGCKNVRVLSVVREASGKWALATSEDNGKIYYTAMEKPKDNIRILGSSDDIKATVDLIPDAAGRDSVTDSLARIAEQGGNLQYPSEPSAPSELK
jgi:hypothetical protein